jgi:hypothetical protein
MGAFNDHKMWEKSEERCSSGIYASGDGSGKATNCPEVSESGACEDIVEISQLDVTRLDMVTLSRRPIFFGVAMRVFLAELIWKGAGDGRREWRTEGGMPSFVS